MDNRAPLDAMKNWSNDEIKQIKEKRWLQSPWHTRYHVEPKTGLLNDPNGFSYFWWQMDSLLPKLPFGAAHGLKSWVQLSDDLVHFATGVKFCQILHRITTVLTLVLPVQFGESVVLFYTGNVRDKADPVTTRLVLWWIRTAKLQKLTRSWLTSRALLTTSAIAKIFNF